MEAADCTTAPDTECNVVLALLVAKVPLARIYYIRTIPTKLTPPLTFVLPPPHPLSKEVEFYALQSAPATTVRYRRSRVDSKLWPWQTRAQLTKVLTPPLGAPNRRSTLLDCCWAGPISDWPRTR